MSQVLYIALICICFGSLLAYTATNKPAYMLIPPVICFGIAGLLVYFGYNIYR